MHGEGFGVLDDGLDAGVGLLASREGSVTAVRLSGWKLVNATTSDYGQEGQL